MSVIGNLNGNPHRAKQLAYEMRMNHTSMVIFNVTDFVTVIKTHGKTITDLGNATNDLNTARKVFQEVKGFGKINLKKWQGKIYVILKKQGGAGNLLKGTRYLATNPKIIELGLGEVGLRNMVRKSAKLSIYLFVGINFLKALEQDKYFLAHFVGHTFVDITKISIAAVLAPSVVISITTVAKFAGYSVLTAGSSVIIAVVLIGGYVSYELNEYDKKEGVTQAVIDKIIEIEKNTDKYINNRILSPAARFIRDMEKAIMGAYRFGG